MGIRLIPKDLAPYVPIAIDSFENVGHISVENSVRQELVT